jgi:V/A-type H+-transporting ATPase subunit C
MPAVRVYAFLHGRLGALKGQLLRDDDWVRLSETRGFAEQQRLLLATSYRQWVTETLDGTIRSLGSALHQTARTVEGSVPPEAADFVRAWARRSVLRNLKTILKGKALARTEDEIRAELLDLDPGTSPPLPLAALVRAPSIESVLDLLEHTDLQHWIHEARRIYERDPTLFGLEAALDRLYYPELRNRIERLKPWDRVVEGLVADEIDQVNLMWLLRYRLNYGLSPAETYYLLIPVTGRVGADTLKRLVRQETIAGVVGQLPEYPFAALLCRCRTVWQVEVELLRYRARNARRHVREAAFTLGEGLALLVLREMEIRDLLAVLEGVRFGRSRAEIIEQLALVPLG